MADQEIKISTDTGMGPHHHVTGGGRPILYATVVAGGVAIGGPLLGMMGFSLVASFTILLISSPLFILFSPLLVAAGLVLITAMIGFGVAAVLAIAGLHAFAWTYNNSTTTGSGHELNIINGECGGVNKITESGQRVLKEQVDALAENKLVQVKKNPPIDDDDDQSNNIK